jgi:hypothetical protein
MGRNSLGAAAKEKVAGVRITRSEEEELKKEFGTTAKALRYLLNKHFTEKLAK